MGIDVEFIILVSIYFAITFATHYYVRKVIAGCVYSHAISFLVFFSLIVAEGLGGGRNTQLSPADFLFWLPMSYIQFLRI